MRRPPDGSRTEYTYDEGGALPRVDTIAHVDEQRIVTSVEYDARGHRARIAHWNDSATDYEHDPLTFRRSHIMIKERGAVLLHLVYTTEPVGNVVQIDDETASTAWVPATTPPGSVAGPLPTR